MDIKLLKDQKWTINGVTRTFKKGLVLSEASLPTDILNDMLRLGYAEVFMKETKEITELEKPKKPLIKEQKVITNLENPEAKAKGFEYKRKR